MSAGSVLVICTGNICRSAVGEAILAERLADLGVGVSSAGTQAAVDRPAPSESVEFVRRVLGTELEHVGRQLDKATAEAADLLITMTTEQRSYVAKLAPRTVRRVFTLVELASVLELLEEDARFSSVKELALAASRLRTQVLDDARDLDIPDPYGGPAEGYETAFTQVVELSEQVSEALHRHVGVTEGEQR